MPDSPPEFGAWDDEFDREILADRLGGGVLYEEDVARIMHVSTEAIKQRTFRGKFPHQLPCEDNQSPRRWAAKDLAGVV